MLLGFAEILFTPQFSASSENVSEKTVLNYHTALSSLWTSLVLFGYAPENIVRRVPPPRPDKKEVVPFSRDGLAALLRAIKDNPAEVRNRAIILLMLDTGLQASELCALTWWIDHILRAMDKSGKEQSLVN